MIAATGVIALTLTPLCSPSLSAQAQEARRVHIRVGEPGGTLVSVNLPPALLEIDLDRANHHPLPDQGRLSDGTGKVNVPDLGRMGNAPSGLGNAAFVQMEDGDTRAHISLCGERVLILADESSHSRIPMEMPTSVVVALLSSENWQLDFGALIRASAGTGIQDMLEIQDGETTVRAWIGDNAGVR